MVYGRNPVRELLSSGRREVVSLHATEQAGDEEWLAPHRPEEATREELARIAGTGDHQGVVARVGPYPYADVRDLLAAPGPVICLDGAHDPRNVGAIARVAEGAGAAGLVIPARGGPGVTAVVSKASAGATEWLPVCRASSVVALVHDARGTGRLAVGAHPDGAEDYRSIAWEETCLVVMGAEGAGLRPRVRDACDVLAAIPMHGRVASLNISVAAGLLLFEAIRNTG
ncbi:MAG: RNA methyltransferase [Miltoncostaeaceae bacterium]